MFVWVHVLLVSVSDMISQIKKTTYFDSVGFFDVMFCQSTRTGIKDPVFLPNELKKWSDNNESVCVCVCVCMCVCVCVCAERLVGKYLLSCLSF